MGASGLCFIAGMARSYGKTVAGKACLLTVTVPLITSVSAGKLGKP